MALFRHAYKIGTGIPAEAIIDHLREKYPDWTFRNHSKGKTLVIRMRKGITTISIARMIGTHMLRVSARYPFWLVFITFRLCNLVKPFATGGICVALNEEVGKYFGT